MKVWQFGFGNYAGGIIYYIISRDFYRHITYNYEYVAKNRPFNLDGEKIDWQNDEAGFNAWKEGKTGYPIVDAAMRQMNSIGWMHNRCRMIVATFLSKDLLVFV